MTYIAFTASGFADDLDEMHLFGKYLAIHISEMLRLEVGKQDAGYYFKFNNHIFVLGSDARRNGWFFRAVKASFFSETPQMSVVSEFATMIGGISGIENVIIGD